MLRNHTGMAETKSREQQGERLKALRQRAKIRSQRQLADRLGVHINTVNAWENDRGEIPYPQAIALARELKTTVDYIYGRTNDPEPATTTGGGSVEERLAAIEGLITALTGPERGVPHVLEVVNSVRLDVGALTTQVEALVLEVSRLRRQEAAPGLSTTADKSKKAPRAKRRPRDRSAE